MSFNRKHSTVTRMFAPDHLYIKKTRLFNHFYGIHIDLFTLLKRMNVRENFYEPTVKGINCLLLGF